MINGVTIPKLSDYSYFDAKSFFTEPKRSSEGIINDLDSYATFLTPRLKFSFKFMPIETYRVLMKMIKERNEFLVTVYDIVEDKYVTHKMYFHPKEFPAIYQNNLETLAVLNESFELVGTNVPMENMSLKYNSNGTTPVLISGLEFVYGQDIVIGTYDSELYSVDPLTFEREGFKRDGWIDSKGNKYLDGERITFSTETTLFANWKSSNLYVLSFDYQDATGGNELLNKNVLFDSLFGTLPSPTKTNYTFAGWYTLPSGKGEQVTDSTLYNFDYNKTIYAKWVENSNA